MLHGIGEGMAHMVAHNASKQIEHWNPLKGPFPWVALAIFLVAAVILVVLKARE